MQSLVVYFTHLSLVLSVSLLTDYGIKDVTSKGRGVYPSDGQTLLSCHQYQCMADPGERTGTPPPPLSFDQNEAHLISRSGSTTEYQLRPCACVCAELQESSISRLSWSFVKESAGLFITQKLRSGVYRISQQSYESYIILRDRIVELAWSKVSTKVCGFKFGSIKLHSSSGDSIDLLSRTFCTTMVVSDLCITKQQFARRHVRHIGLSTRSNGGHVGVTNQSCGS